MSLIVVGLLALGVAILVPCVPYFLYEKNYDQKAQQGLGATSDAYPSMWLDKPITVLITGGNNDLGLACVQDLVQRAANNNKPIAEDGAPLLTIVMGCFRTNTMEDTPTSCHQARDQVLERVTGTTEGKVNLLPMTIDLVDPSNSNTHSVEQFAVELQKRLPKPEGAPAPPIHVVIYAAKAIYSFQTSPIVLCRRIAGPILGLHYHRRQSRRMYPMHL